MRKRAWTEQDKQTLTENYGKLSYEAIGKLLGKTTEQVKNAASRYKITVSKKWTDSQTELLRNLYPDTKTQLIADQLGVGLTAVYRMANSLGLKKSDAFMASDECGRMTKENRIRRGLDHRFEKGHIPANKGLRRPGWHAGRMKETQFKKGVRQGVAERLYKPIGTERITKDGYLQRKVNDDLPLQQRWKLVQRIVWEEHHGPVPKSHVIAFKDGNKLNFAIDNLECVSRAEWMKRHTLHNYPEPVKEAIHILGGFRRKLNSYAKKQDRRSAKHALRDNGKTT